MFDVLDVTVPKDSVNSYFLEIEGLDIYFRRIRLQSTYKYDLTILKNGLGHSFPFQSFSFCFEKGKKEKKEYLSVLPPR